MGGLELSLQGEGKNKFVPHVRQMAVLFACSLVGRAVFEDIAGETGASFVGCG